MSRKYFGSRKARPEPVATPIQLTLPALDAPEFVRFVLKSGNHIDMQLDSIEEVHDHFLGVDQCAIVGLDTMSRKTIVPWSNLDYISEVAA